MQIDVQIVATLLMVGGGGIALFSGLRQKSFVDAASGLCFLGLAFAAFVSNLDGSLVWLSLVFGASLLLLALARLWRLRGGNGSQGNA